LTQAVQAVEAVHAWTQQHYKDNPDPHKKMNDLADLKADLERITAKHNEFVGKIQVAKQEAERNPAQETSDDPYQTRLRFGRGLEISRPW
jgi:hypothetical protein